jgi:hypothetical protein
MSYDGELEVHIIFDVRFRATNADANDVFILLSCMKDWRELDTLDSMLRYGNWNMQPAPTEHPRVIEALRETAKRHTELRSLCSQHVRDLVRAKGIEA